MNWFDYRFFGNTLLDWLIAFVIALALIVALRHAQTLILHRLRAYADKTSSPLDDFAADIIGATRYLFLLAVAIYVGAQSLELPARTARIVSNVFVVALMLQLALWGHRAVTFWIGQTLQRKRALDGASIVTMSAIGFMVRLVLWSVTTLMILDNLGINVTALIASLGIVGIAVALAVQNILGDVFASLSITLDRPFVVGDFIVAGDTMGAVEHIGIKTTRVRSISGEQIILPNADLLKSRIRNYKRMAERRVQFGFGVPHATPPEKLERIPAMVRAVIENLPKVRFERTHFKEYGEHSFNFEVVYFVHDPDFNLYMDIQHAINIALLRRLQEDGTGMTRTTAAFTPTAVTAPAPSTAPH